MRTTRPIWDAQPTEDRFAARSGIGACPGQVAPSTPNIYCSIPRRAASHYRLTRG